MNAARLIPIPGSDKQEIKGMAYNEEADKKSWEKTLALFKETLGK